MSSIRKALAPARHIDRRIFVSGAVALLALGGCGSTPAPAPRPQSPPRARFDLDVSALEIVTLYRAPSKAPNVDHEFPLTPQAAARSWAQERLSPVGPRGRVIFTVAEASVVEVALPREGGLRGVVTVDQSERYDGALAVEVAIVNGETKIAAVNARATHSRTVPENLSVNARRQVWAEMTETLVVEMDKKLEEQIRQFLASWIVR